MILVCFINQVGQEESKKDRKSAACCDKPMLAAQLLQLPNQAKLKAIGTR